MNSALSVRRRGAVRTGAGADADRDVVREVEPLALVVLRRTGEAFGGAFTGSGAGGRPWMHVENGRSQCSQ
jgi:hypothetical protein